jgi:large subunit ribosomal protein L17
MRHGVKKRVFSRTNKQRDALIIGLAKSLISHEKITTTEAKAKTLRPYVEKLITHSKKTTLGSVRLLRAQLGEDLAVKMVKVIAPQFKDRQGGYTRIRHLAPRVSDGARMAVIEFVK